MSVYLSHPFSCYVTSILSCIDIIILDKLEYLGVHIAGKKLFLILAEHTPLLNLDMYGLKINKPHGTIPLG